MSTTWHIIHLLARYKSRFVHSLWFALPPRRLPAGGWGHSHRKDYILIDFEEISA
jgi:hypothetical protein